jgi:CDP-diacylglycerol--glycerol-3-phosphate 3-phosphatidyltransferase
MLRKLFRPSFPKNHGYGPSSHETILTWASAVTALRLVGTLYFVMVAMQSMTLEPIVYALAFYWVGDVFDGMIARATNRETQLGAVFDIASDRLSVVMIYMLFALYMPSLTWPMVIFLVAFVVIDTILSMSFLKFNLLSINYFYLIDKKIYDLNWSMPAKVATTSLFMLVALLLQSVVLSLIVALIVLALKSYSLYLLQQIKPTKL